MSRFSPGFLSSGGVPGNDSFTKILLHMNGSNGATTFQDEAVGASVPRSWTSVGATVDATAGAFSSGAMKGPYITTPAHADFDLGASPFTADFRINCNGNGGSYGVAGVLNSAGTLGSHEFIIFSGILAFNLWVGAVTYQLIGPNIASAGLVHVAAVRDNASTIRLYVNGVMQAARSDLAGQATNATGSSYSIGRVGDNASAIPSTVVIDEYRLSAGIARWTGGTTFTPPTAPYI